MLFRPEQGWSWLLFACSGFSLTRHCCRHSSDLRKIWTSGLAMSISECLSRSMGVTTCQPHQLKAWASGALQPLNRSRNTAGSCGDGGSRWSASNPDAQANVGCSLMKPQSGGCALSSLALCVAACGRVPTASTHSARLQQHRATMLPLLAVQGLRACSVVIVLASPRS